MFLRTEEKKRENARAKEPTPATPIQAAATPALSTPNPEAPVAYEPATESSKADYKPETSVPADGEQSGADNGAPSNGQDAAVEPVCRLCLCSIYT